MSARRRAQASVVGAAVFCLTATALAAPAVPATNTFPYNGADVSWPQCPVGGSMPMPNLNTRFVIFGLTGGYGFTLNPCLADQVAWAKARGKYLGAYSFTGSPSFDEYTKYGGTGPFKPLTKVNRFRNTGFAVAQQTIDEMKAAKLTVPFVWLDIEPSKKRPWRTETWKNRAYIQGQVKAYSKAGIKAGFYLSASSFDLILGKDYQRPEWQTVGPKPRTEALKRCDAEPVQGGPIVLVQWWTDTNDYDLMCPDYRKWKLVPLYFTAPS
jgi:hypothetical protein